MHQTVLVTGTATGVGKTVVALAIASYYQMFCTEKSLAVFKPIDTKAQDRLTYQKVLSLQQPVDDMTSVCLGTSFDPPIALKHEGKSLNLADVWQRYQAFTQSHDLVLIEACGSLGTPLTPETTVADLAWDWRLPSLLIVPVQPGAVGLAIAHVALARQSRIHLKGIVLNCPTPLSDDDCADLAPSRLIQSLTQIPVLGCIPYLENVGDRTTLANVASNLNIEQILSLG